MPIQIQTLNSTKKATLKEIHHFVLSNKIVNSVTNTTKTTTENVLTLLSHNASHRIWTLGRTCCTGRQRFLYLHRGYFSHCGNRTAR